MELKIVEKETTNETKMNTSIQKKRILQSKYILLMFLTLMILGSGYNIRINDVHNKESKSTLTTTVESMKKVLKDSKENVGREKSLAQHFYKNQNFQPLWTTGFRRNHYGETLESILINSDKYGLRKNINLEKEINTIKEKMYASSSLGELSNLRAGYEIKLTEAAVAMLIQLDKGIVYFDTINEDQITNYYTNYLQKSLQADNFEEAFLSIQPNNKIYLQLISGLRLFITRSSLSKTKYKIDFESFESVKKNVSPIFYELGYISDKSDLDSIEFVEHLKTFQKYHGIKQSGTLCKNTIAALEMSPYDRYQQILLNIERARSEKFSEDTYIFVNIPAYNLRLFQEGKLAIQHRVMVGKPESQTPVLSSKMEFMVANPKWYVPKSISQGEILYKLRKDSTYLETRNFVLLDKDYQPIAQDDVNWEEINYKNFDYKIYQEPGSGNALGKIKFMFPNEYSVYVHDTQAKRLFSDDYRAYSHGCIRLENPLDFADHLLTHVDQDNLYKTIKPMVKSEKTKEIKFTKPVDIHIRYYTCEVDESNNIYFYQDIYEKDKVLKEQLFLN